MGFSWFLTRLAINDFKGNKDKSYLILWVSVKNFLCAAKYSSYIRQADIKL